MVDVIVPIIANEIPLKHPILSAMFNTMHTYDFPDIELNLPEDPTEFIKYHIAWSIAWESTNNERDGILAVVPDMESLLESLDIAPPKKLKQSAKQWVKNQSEDENA